MCAPGRWSSIMPTIFVETLDLTSSVRAIPIRDPDAVHTVGLLVPEREPLPALTAALTEYGRSLQLGLNALA